MVAGGGGAQAGGTAAIALREPDGRRLLVRVDERLFIGRRCQGVDPLHRLLLEGERVSRDHCHILVDTDLQRATVVDTSTNGTRLNGHLIERSVPIQLRHGDRLSVGQYELEFVAESYLDSGNVDLSQTLRSIEQSRMCVVCGDVVDYTTLTEAQGGAAVFGAIQAVFDDLRALLSAHRGTLFDYVGDAFLAVWEETTNPAAARAGVDFALEATRRIAALAPTLALRYTDGTPLRMGWAVTYGDVAVSSYAGALAGLLGDAVNLGFRLASLAGRGGRTSVIVTDEVYERLGGAVPAGPPQAVMVKGRTAAATIREVVVSAALADG